jgi:hypothetical protein
LTPRQQRIVARTVRREHARPLQVTFTLQHRGRLLVVVAGLAFDLTVLVAPWVVGVITLIRHLVGG